MVFFSCNACNESLKKNQVEKHYLHKCRRCESLTCIDCGKEFWGDSYQAHTKCISEEEKYSGKDYVAKPNKGEVKQEQWIQKVQLAIQKAPADPQLKNLLQRLEEYPNVPRKKSKFENFLKCSLRVVNKWLVDQVWDLLMAEAQQQNSNTANTDNKVGSNAQPVTSAEQAETSETADPASKDAEKKLSKRERKEERKRKKHKGEKKDKHDDTDNAAAEKEDGGKKKKGKRRKREEEEEVEEIENGSCEVESRPKKKKRKVESEEAEEEAPAENGSGDHDDHVQKEKKGKFDWGATIMAVLKSKGEMSVKRLQKKVLAEYASYGSSKSGERVEAKFEKKLKTLPGVKLSKDKAILKQS